MREAAALIVLAVLVAFAAIAAIPWAAEKRDYPASIPQASPLFFTSVIALRPGSEACSSNAVVEEHSEEMRFRIGTRFRPGAPLTARIAGRGYSQRVEIPGGYPDNLLHAIAIEPPRRATPVRICIRNRGDRRMDVYGAADRTRSRSFTRVDGRPADADMVVGFWERRERSILERVSDTIGRMTVLRAGVVDEWLLWTLGALFLLGMPAALAWGFARSLRG